MKNLVNIGNGNKIENSNICSSQLIMGKDIKGKVDTGGILAEDCLCKKEDKMIINTIHKLKENGYNDSEITTELVMKEIKETYGFWLMIKDDGLYGKE